MRKFLAALLAVFMLTATLAALPVAAAEPAAHEVSDKDGSTVADVPDLVVTEMMADTTSTVGNNPNANAFQYVEVYNRGTTAVNLINLAVVRGANKLTSDTWNKDHKFDAMLPIKAGNVYTGTSAKDTTYECVNPGSAMLQPGQFAIIWFWNDASIQASKDVGSSLGASTTSGSKTVYHKGFREHYNRLQGQGSISDDMLIVAVYAGTSTDTANAPTFSLNTSSSYMYGLVKNEVGNAFDYKSEKAYQSYYNSIDKTTTYTRNDKVVCLWEYDLGTAASGNYEGMAATFIPADKTPDFYNAQQIAYGNEAKGANRNAYEAELVESFKQFALVSMEEKMLEEKDGKTVQVPNLVPTVGKMDAWQWAYVDPSRAPADVKALAANGKTWQEVAIAAYNTVNVVVLEDEASNEEVNKNQGDITVNRDDLGNKGQNVKDDGTGTTEDGLGIWLWVIIGGAAAVVLAGVAVVLIIVLKKKKPVAEDDVEAEGDIEIIDEQGSDE